MKKALVLNFSFIAIILSVCFISFVVIVVVNFHNTFSGPNQKDIEVAASRTLNLYGFKGEVKVTKFSRYRWPSEDYEIEYDYTEEVNGRKITVSDSLIYFPKSPGNSKRTSEEIAYDGTTKTMLREFSGIADQLLNQHPDSVSNKEKVENFFKQFGIGLWVHYINATAKNRDSMKMVLQRQFMCQTINAICATTNDTHVLIWNFTKNFSQNIFSIFSIFSTSHDSYANSLNIDTS